LASEHARDYPTGAFVQEREVLAIDALQRLNRHAEAVGRAQRFRATYPTSTYLPHVQAIVDAP
jgi:outer membrane protein assembly factor BamD (BamD/ComL family)